MIEVSGLRKSYRTRRRRKVTKVDAVRGVDFAVERGEIFARDWIFASSIVQARPRSTTVMSASEPGTITPFRG